MTETAPRFNWRTALGYTLGVGAAAIGVCAWALLVYSLPTIFASLFPGPPRPHGGGENNFAGMGALFYAAYMLLASLLAFIASAIGKSATHNPSLQRIFRFGAITNGWMIASLLILWILLVAL